MHVAVETPQELGAVLRAVRKAQGIRSDDLAHAAQVGPVFVLDVEHGKQTAQVGKVLQLLSEMGIKVILELPEPISQDTHIQSRRGTKFDGILQRTLARLKQHGNM